MPNISLVERAAVREDMRVQVIILMNTYKSRGLSYQEIAEQFCDGCKNCMTRAVPESHNIGVESQG